MSGALAPVCAALGDETRWSILAALGGGPASASALARVVPVSRQAVARHLEVLQRVGLVETEKVGREVRYQALGSRLDDLARDLARIGAEWDRQLALIKRLAEAP